MNIGYKIRYIRKSQKRTLQEIADQCGFTKGLLSKIENNHITPPISTITKIANALGVKISALLDESGNKDKTVFTKRAKSEDSKGIKTSKGYFFIPIATDRIDKTMQPYIFFAKKGDIKRQPMSHQGEEFIFILDGEVKFRVGSIEYIMQPGDSLYFNALEEHELSPISDTVKYLGVFTQ